jgi:hypothetical protein
MNIMKKFLLTATLLAFTSSIFAQTFNIGLKAGINSGTITTDSPNFSGYSFSNFKSDVKNGFNIGGFARLGFTKWYIQPELLYSVRKGNTDLNVANSGGTGLTSGLYSQSVNVNSIQVPILLGYKLLDLKLVSLRVFTGPAMSVILNNSSIKLSNSSGVAVDPSLYNPNTFKNNVWNWQLGGGVDVGPLVLDARYEWGLTNVSEGDATKIGFVNKGNMLTFSLGYKFF